MAALYSATAFSGCYGVVMVCMVVYAFGSIVIIVIAIFCMELDMLELWETTFCTLLCYIHQWSSHFNILRIVSLAV